MFIWLTSWLHGCITTTNCQSLEPVHSFGLAGFKPSLTQWAERLIYSSIQIASQLKRSSSRICAGSSSLFTVHGDCDAAGFIITASSANTPTLKVMNDLYLAFSDIKKGYFLCAISIFRLGFFAKCVLNQSFGGNEVHAIRPSAINWLHLWTGVTLRSRFYRRRLGFFFFLCASRFWLANWPRSVKEGSLCSASLSECKLCFNWNY